MATPWDPYAPAATRAPRPAPPLARLRRLGAGPDVVKAVAGWWAAMGETSQRSWGAALNVTTDADLRADWAPVPGLGTAPADDVVAWAEGHRIPAAAAAVALKAEWSRPKNRRRVATIARLERIEAGEPGPE